MVLGTHDQDDSAVVICGCSLFNVDSWRLHDLPTQENLAAAFVSDITSILPHRPSRTHKCVSGSSESAHHKSIYM